MSNEWVEECGPDGFFALVQRDRDDKNKGRIVTLSPLWTSNLIGSQLSLCFDFAYRPFKMYNIPCMYILFSVPVCIHSPNFVLVKNIYKKYITFLNLRVGHCVDSYNNQLEEYTGVFEDMDCLCAQSTAPK